MQVFYGIIPIIWMILFILSFFIDSSVIEYTLGFISIIYIIEILYKLYKSKSVKSFLKDHWFDILLVIPIFRGLKIARSAKLLRIGKNTSKIFSGLEMTSEIIEISRKVKKKT